MSKEIEQSDALVRAMQTGLATVDQIQEASRLVSISLAGQLLMGTGALMETVKPIAALHNKLVARYQEVLEQDMEIMTREDLENAIGVLSKNLINSLEVQRKIVQGKEILSNYPALTEEEKSMVKMMQSFKTADEKKIFIETLRSAISTNNAAGSTKKDVVDDFEDTSN